MLCEHCGINEAEVTVGMMVNGQMKYVHLCHECAENCTANMSNSDDPKYVMRFIVNSEPLENFEDILKGLEEMIKKTIGSNLNGKIIKKTYKHICPHCGKPLPDSMFESDTHKNDISKADGKGESHESAVEKIIKLRAKLEKAVKAEEYEKASVIRDEILLLKQPEKNLPEDNARDGTTGDID